MPNEDYTFIIPTDIAAVNASKLDAEIRGSSISTALAGVYPSATSVKITFKAALSAQDETTLHGDTTAPAGGLLAAGTHDSTPSTPIHTVQVVESDGQPAPVTALRTPIFQPSIVPPGYFYYNTGAWDWTGTKLDGSPLDSKTVAEINALTPVQGESYLLSDGGDITLGATRNETGLVSYAALTVAADDLVLFRDGAWWRQHAMGCRGCGQQMVMTQTGPGEVSVEGRMKEHAYILGGKYKGSGAKHDDRISMMVRAPASTPAANGGGTGNATLEAYGPVQRFKPVIGTGDYDVDGSAMECGEINQGLCPIPNADGIGYWNWDPTASPSIIPAPDMDGTFDLFPFGMEIARQCNELPLNAGGIITPSSIKGKKLLPHWIYRFTLMVATQAGEVSASASIRMARLATL